MKGCLIVNAYMHSAKFDEIYWYLQKAFEKRSVPLDILTNDKAIKLTLESELLYDFIVFWDKDIYLCGALESMGYKVYNSVYSTRVCDDKALTYLELSGKNIKMPKTIIAPHKFDEYSNFDFVDTAIGALGFPLIIKENFGSFGKQVYLAGSREKAVEIIKQIGKKPFLFQEFIKTSFGRDIRVQVVGDKIVTAVLRTAEDGQFISNATFGGKMRPTQLNARQKEFSLRVCGLLKMDFAGLDILFGENDEPVLCEVNSNAHFKNILDATGVNTADFIADYIIGKL